MNLFLDNLLHLNSNNSEIKKWNISSELTMFISCLQPKIKKNKKIDWKLQNSSKSIVSIRSKTNSV